MLKNVSFFLKLSSFFLLVFIWVYTMITYGKLPETVPIHFDLDGTADGFGSKNTNWFLAGISSAIFILMMYLSQNPNAPGLNIPENLKKDPAISEFVVSILCVLTMFLFANRISFYHPITKELIDIELDIPNEYLNIIKKGN